MLIWFLGDVRHTGNHPWEWLDHKWQCLIRRERLPAVHSWTEQHRGVKTPSRRHHSSATLLTIAAINQEIQTRRTSENPPGCPVHLWEIHPSLSRPCSLPSRCRRPSSPSSCCSSSGCGTRTRRLRYNRFILFKLAERPVSMCPDGGDLARTCSFLGFAATVRCWGCGGLICPELRADWWSRNDAEDVSNRLQSLQQTVYMSRWLLNWLGQELQLPLIYVVHTIVLQWRQQQLNLFRKRDQAKTKVTG